MKWTESSKIFTITIIFICLPLLGTGIWYLTGITPSKPTIIYGDEELAAYSSRGNGTINDPYIIERVNYKQRLIIEYTQSYFIVQYCTAQTTDIGILLLGIRNNTATLQHNTLFDCSIYLRYSDGVNVINNSFSHLGELVITGSFSLRIYNNSFENYGISIVWDDPYYDPSSTQDHIPFVYDYANNILADLEIAFFFNYSNLIIDQQYGQIFLQECVNCTIQNQEMKKAKIGIFTYRTNNCVIINNEFNKCYQGVYLIDTVGFDFHNNSFSYESYSPCSLRTSRTSIGNISNNSFEGADNFRGIEFIDSNNIIVSRNILQGCKQGLHFDNCENIVVWKNHIEHTTYTAVFVIDSNSLVFYQNNFIDTEITEDEASQAGEHLSTNIKWYNTTLSIGNYWNTWSGIGWYKIGTATTAENYDLFPLAIPVDVYS